MVLTNITKDEEKRFIRYQEKGLLPNQALRKIEIERRTGIIEEEPTFLGKFDENIWYYVAGGTIGLAAIVIYVNSWLKKSSTSTTQPQNVSSLNALAIDNIEGIDSNSLSICRNKGLI